MDFIKPRGGGRGGGGVVEGFQSRHVYAKKYNIYF